MSDRGGEKKNLHPKIFLGAQRLLSTNESNGWKLYPALPGWKDSHMEKETSKA